MSASMAQTRGDLPPAPARASISVLARTSVQVVLLVLVGSTGFLLSVVCTLLDLARPTSTSRVAKARRKNAEGAKREHERGQRQGIPSPSTASPARRPRRQGTDSTVASSSSAASSSRGIIDGSRSSLPDLVFSTGASGSSRTSTATSSSTGSLASVGSEVEQYHALSSAPLVIEPPSQVSSLHERRARIDISSPQQQQKKSRRCSLDLVRASLHIPTPSRSFSPPPTSRPSSISSCSEIGDLLHPTSPTLGSRPKFGRLFSRASSAEKEREKQHNKAAHLVEVSEGDEPAPLPTPEQEQQEQDGTTPKTKRRSSIRWSSFRSKGRRAVSEADGTDEAVPHSLSLLHVSDAHDEASSHDERHDESDRPHSPRLPSSPRLSGFKSPIKSRLPGTGVSASPTKPSERRGRPCPRRAVSECISHSGSITPLSKKQQQSPPRPQQPNRHQLMAWSQHEQQRQEARNAGVVHA